MPRPPARVVAVAAGAVIAAAGTLGCFTVETPATPPADGAIPSVTPTLTPTTTPIAAATPVRCEAGDLATPPLGDTRDAWTRARAALPGVPLYRPATPPPGFDTPTLLAACVEDGQPQVTVVYRADDDYLALLVNHGRSSYGNSPGPGMVQRVTVRGVEATMMTAAAMPPRPASIGLSWREGGQIYQVKAQAARLTTDDLRRLVEALVPVP